MSEQDKEKTLIPDGEIKETSAAGKAKSNKNKNDGKSKQHKDKHAAVMRELASVKEERDSVIIAAVKRKSQQLAAEREKRNQSKNKAARPNMIAAIVDRGKSLKFKELLDKNGVFFSSVCMGQGTASSDILDILGLESSEKDIVISIAKESSAKAVMNALSDKLGSLGTKGIAFRVRLNAAPNILLKALDLKAAKSATEVKSEMNDKKSSYSLVLVSISQGYADEVMATAKKAGARGGTLIRARQTTTEETEALFGAGYTPEREIIAILVTADNRNAIMEAINENHGVRTEANAIVISLAVEDIAKLS